MGVDTVYIMSWGICSDNM